MNVVRELATLFGRGDRRRCAPDWGVVEERLGTRLPADYKELVEVFGPGAFGGYLQVLCPGPEPGNLADSVAALADWADAFPETGERYAPHGVYPRGRLLMCATAPDDRGDFHWLTGPGDPDGWTIMARDTDYHWEHLPLSLSQLVLNLASGADAGDHAWSYTRCSGGETFFQPYLTQDEMEEIDDGYVPRYFP
jgi:hypothetical protein